VQELLLLINYCRHSDFSYAAEYRACQYADINYSKIPRRADGAKACTLLQQQWKGQFVAENSFAKLDIERVKKVTRCIHFII